MQFLWELLPGAREARNQLAIGYAWLAAAALVVGVPQPSGSSNLAKLVDAVGPVGVGIAVSFAALLLGSALAEYLSKPLGIRGARFLTAESGNDPAAIYTPEIRDEVIRLRSERDHAEAEVDKLNSEVILRFFLIPPVLVFAVVAILDHEWSWTVVAAAATGVLLVQGRSRLIELQDHLHTSMLIRKRLGSLPTMGD